ncbi:MAG: hypothetical protein AAGI25_08790, partial [Bacteroidota bacterium]
TVIEDLTLLDDDQGWPGLATLIRIEAQRMEKSTGKTTTSTRYYISSKKEKSAGLQCEHSRALAHRKQSSLDAGCPF